MFKAEQQLNEYCTFNDYPTMLIKLFNGVIESPDTYKIQMDLNEDNSADLFFKRQMTFKEVIMLQIPFDTADRHVPLIKKSLDGEEEPDSELIKQHIRHRHNIAKEEMEAA